MAVAIASSTTANTGAVVSGTSTATPAKPTGLTVGDMLVCFCGGRSTGNDLLWSGPGGWTQVDNTRSFDGSSNTGGGQGLFWKIADSGDVAASTFSFSAAAGVGNSTSGSAILMRVTGFNPINPQPNFNTGIGRYTGGSGTSHSWGGITQSYANSLLIIGAAFDNGGGISSEAIVTSDPGFTELVEATNGNVHVAVAYAIRTPQTATGNASFAIASPNANIWNMGGIYEIAAPQAVLVQPAVFSIVGNLLAPTVHVGIHIVMTVKTALFSIIDPVIRRSRTFTRESKHDGTFTNEQKH